MRIVSTGSNMLALLSAAQGAAFIADIAFYVNLGLCFCALVALTALIVLLKKTLCARSLGIAAAVVLSLGLAIFVVQLGLYTTEKPYAAYFVYACSGVIYAAFILFGAYCCLLSKNSYGALSIATGVTCLIPPAGAVFSVILSYRIRRDTNIKKLVFSGYAYTYAALCAFSEENKAELIDSAGEAERERLSKKQIRKKLKTLKRKAKTAEGKFEYATAIVNYVPYKFKKAFKLIKSAADTEYAPAMFNLGYYYDIGFYVKRDDKKARYYYERAAACGDADAELRAILLDVKGADASSGLAALEARANGGDMCAKYDLGVCCELGLGCDRDEEKAFAIYTECANSDMFTAQRRIFAAASNDMSSASNGALFRRITDRTFTSPEFAAMIDGLIEVKKRLAADASEKFLQAVKFGGKWEGVARCLVGTLYIDCGKLREDRANGAEYVRSALDIWEGAAEVYAAIPKAGLKQKNKKR